jgi:hypothetical protein
MITLTTAQTAFFTQNGYLELEGLFTPEECEEYRPLCRPGRDNWRRESALRKLLVSRQMAHIVCQVTRKDAVRLAGDQWFEAGFSLPKPEKWKDFFSIQGLLLALFIQWDSGSYELPAKMSKLGVSPYPHGQGNAVLVGPNLLLNWPASNQGLYLAFYSVPSAVYVNNPKDPAATALKKLGYGYGDLLRNETHPLLTKP